MALFLDAAHPVPALHLFVQNLAGHIEELNLQADATVGDLQRRVLDARLVECNLSKVRLFVERVHLPGSDAAPSTEVHVMLDDETRSLTSYGIADGAAVHAVVREHSVGEFVCSLGGAGLLNQPACVCISPATGDIFIADCSNHRVVVLRAKDGALVRTMGGTQGDDDDLFCHPMGVFATPSDELFVADTGNHRVQVRRASDGVFLRTIRGRRRNFHPVGVCVTDDGILFVADHENHCIQVWRASDSTHLRIIGGDEGNDNDQFSHPLSVCVTPDAQLLYVADCNNHRVQVLRASDGAHVRTIGGAGAGGQPLFHEPNSICLTASGDLCIANSLTHSVAVVRVADGQLIRILGGLGSQPGQLNYPLGVCIAADGNLLVVDCHNHRVQVFAM